jgi:hypothetical protein
VQINQFGEQPNVAGRLRKWLSRFFDKKRRQFILYSAAYLNQSEGI